MISAYYHQEWEAAGFKDYAEFSDCVEYINQRDYGDHNSGQWFYGDDDALVIYNGTFGNDNSPGASIYTYAEQYDTKEEYQKVLAVWESYPEYLESEEESEDEES